MWFVDDVTRIVCRKSALVCALDPAVDPDRVFYSNKAGTPAASTNTRLIWFRNHWIYVRFHSPQAKIAIMAVALNQELSVKTSASSLPQTLSSRRFVHV
jgi:hypothetical protein